MLILLEVTRPIIAQSREILCPICHALDCIAPADLGRTWAEMQSRKGLPCTGEFSVSRKRAFQPCQLLLVNLVAAVRDAVQSISIPWEMILATDDTFDGKLTSLWFRDADIQAGQELPAIAQEPADIAADEALNLQRNDAALADGFQVPEVSSVQCFHSPNVSIPKV